KRLRIQRRAFLPEERELDRSEYKRLVAAAELTENKRLSLILQTICATGIRVSELQFITAEAVRTGRAFISCKGKSRVVFLPDKLRKILSNYIGARGITSGAVFVSRAGNPLDRSNVWREMKKLCAAAGVARGKVFPHNLRHLFARTYYSMEKDLSRLADFLGHSSVNTTRIYTMESGREHARQINRLGLVLNST
ncbi:MAG: tyrosine-type recombinase/integrase, partial [Oscillospiraceae bacterium]|nr:tyrosine-type recombinase/integrase [Oscillospiraceae bacterium]